ncbi:MAG TPA: AAA family ATPase, partial [Acidimicrobiales bacterium]|nr:AAA family ATPase [Acidimicrobiales bacterium]
MAGRHRAHPVTDLGEMELKGLPARVPVVEVGWEPVALEVGTCGPVPLPSRLDATPASGFVGRNEQSQALEVAWKNVVQGGTHVVMISGEPGIGKTRLAREAATAAHTGGAIVLLGSCDEAVEAPFRPWIEALGHLVRHAPDEVISSLGPVRLGSLCLLLPDARERGGLDGPASSDPETERYQLFSAVVALLEAAAASAPVMLVLDDLHWADRASLVLLRHLVSAGPCPGLMIIGTYRDADVGADHPLADVLAGLRREQSVERLSLVGLSDAEVVALVEAAAGADTGEAGAEFAHALYRETDGNPFFAWELMQHLVETGWAVRAKGKWEAAQDGATLELPDSVKEVIGRRVIRLVTGRLAEAEALATEALNLGERTGQPGVLVRYAALMFSLRWHQGRPEDVDDIVQRARQADDTNLDILRLAAVGLPADEDLDAEVSAIRGDPAWLQTYTLLAERAARSGNPKAVAVLYERLVADGECYSIMSPSRGPVALQLALLSAAAGQTDRSAEWFQRAASANTAIGAPFHTARTNIEWARFLLRAGSPPTPGKGARDLLMEAQEAARRFGYAGLDRRAARMLRET